jgi:hypothetical protein
MINGLSLHPHASYYIPQQLGFKSEISFDLLIYNIHAQQQRETAAGLASHLYIDVRILCVYNIGA